MAQFRDLHDASLHHRRRRRRRRRRRQADALLRLQRAHVTTLPAGAAHIIVPTMSGIRVKVRFFFACRLPEKKLQQLMKRAHPESAKSAGSGAAAHAEPSQPPPPLSESDCSSLAAALIADMNHWFEATGDCPRQLVSAFVESEGSERAVLEMLMEIRLTAAASRITAALRAIRTNFGDAVAMFLTRDERRRDVDWQRSCVLQHVRSWISATPRLSGIWLYKLNQLYPDLPDSWKRSLLFTEEATYSITPSPASRLLCDKIMERGGSANATIVDSFACVGGDTAVFSRRFRNVHSIELDSEKIPLLRHNVRLCLNCPFQREEDAAPPSEMLSLPENVHIHAGDCRAIIPTLQLVSKMLLHCFRFV